MPRNNRACLDYLASTTPLGLLVILGGCWRRRLPRFLDASFIAGTELFVDATGQI